MYCWCSLSVYFSPPLTEPSLKQETMPPSSSAPSIEHSVAHRKTWERGFSRRWKKNGVRSVHRHQRFESIPFSFFRDLADKYSLNPWATSLDPFCILRSHHSVQGQLWMRSLKISAFPIELSYVIDAVTPTLQPWKEGTTFNSPSWGMLDVWALSQAGRTWQQLSQMWPVTLLFFPGLLCHQRCGHLLQQLSCRDMLRKVVLPGSSPPVKDVRGTCEWTQVTEHWEAHSLGFRGCPQKEGAPDSYVVAAE